MHMVDWLLNEEVRCGNRRVVKKDGLCSSKEGWFGKVLLALQEIWTKYISCNVQSICMETKWIKYGTQWPTPLKFLLHFPHPFISSELSGFRGNDSKSMSTFLFENILPIIHCSSLQKVLNWHFCKFVAMCWAAKFKVQQYTTNKKLHHISWNRNRDTLCMYLEWRLKILVVVISFAPPSLKITKLWQICYILSQDSYIAYGISNKVVRI